MKELASTSNPRLAYLIASLFLIGMYLPTSVGEVGSGAAVAASVALLGAFFAALIFMNGISRQSLVWIALSIPATLIACTFISPLTRIEFGAIYIYCMLGLLYLLRLKNIPWRPVIGRAFLLVNVVNVVMGLGIILQYEPILQFLKNYYTFSYPELLPLMLAARKPVIMFATHSVAGFFFFLFFWLNLRTYEATAKRLYLGFAVIYMVFALFLFSFTSLFFLAWEMGLLTKVGLQRSWKLTVVIVLLLGSAGVFLWQSLDNRKYDLLDYATNYLQSSGNGLVGRYSATGDLVVNLEFIRAHPLRPIGLTSKSGFMDVDSGPVEYVLRGSLPLLLAIYIGLFGFLQSNLADRRDLRIVLVAILLFELGYAILGYARTLSVLPFFIVYLNGIQEAASGSLTIPKSQARAA